MTGSGIPARYIRLRWVGDQSYVDTETPNHLDQPHPWEED
jgi:hypothetical protein